MALREASGYVPALNELLAEIPTCSACYLMAENRVRNVPYIPILPKPSAKVVFIGRDPSPRTAQIVGVRGGRSVFANEVFRLCDQVGISESTFYITDLCKCHWRTSGGTPYPGTELRRTRLDQDVARACCQKWLSRELEILSPRLIVAFGEEVYQLLRPAITVPCPPPARLSWRRDKAGIDGEKWYVENGHMEVELGGLKVPLAVLRHPGNSSRLAVGVDGDRRMEYHRAATKQTLKYLRDRST